MHRVEGLGTSASARLLAQSSRRSVGRFAAARIAIETEGNPGALIEVSRRLTDEQLEGRSALPAALPMAVKLRTHILNQLAGLPTSINTFLVLVASMVRAHPSALAAAARRLDLPSECLNLVQEIGILTAVDPTTFRHPLLRAALLSAADPGVLQRINEVLVDVSAQAGETDLAAWYQSALSSSGLDEHIAMELEQSADVAAQRGGPEARAMFLGRAADLSVSQHDKGLRLVASARAHLAAGNGELAEALLQDSLQWLDGAAIEIDICQLRAAIDAFFCRHQGVPVLLLAASEQTDSADVEAKRGLLLDALQSAIVAGRYSLVASAYNVAERLESVPSLASGPPFPGRDVLLHALALRVMHDHREAAGCLALGVQSLFREDTEGGSPLVAVLGCLAADDLWDDRARSAMLARAIAQPSLPCTSNSGLHVALACASVGYARAGDIARGENTIRHLMDVGVLDDTSCWPVADSLLQIQALKGSEWECRKIAAANLEWARDHGVELAEMQSMAAVVTLEIGLGNYSEAAALGQRIMEADPPGVGNQVLCDVLEAAVRTGDTGLASSALERLQLRATASGTPWALGILNRSLALSNDSAAESLYLAAITSLARTSAKFDLARTHLLYGEWLRRQKRRSAAHTELRAAHRYFTAMGAIAFAQRAHHEILATGYSKDANGPGEYGLTPQEKQVADLAAKGATNAEIATKLCLTTSTIEYHLNKVFRKVGVTSRRHLSRVLTDWRDSAPDVPARAYSA